MLKNALLRNALLGNVLLRNLLLYNPLLRSVCTEVGQEACSKTSNESSARFFTAGKKVVGCWLSDTRQRY